MALRGAPLDAGAKACPFIALELDRDRRSDRPDYRHRCYAEQIPAPRTIAHQERYCLSPNFSGCPIFQDWAVRAAARPVGLAGLQATAVPSPGVAAAAAEMAAPNLEPPDAQVWPDSMETPVAAVAEESAGGEQLSAFDASPPATPMPAEMPAPEPVADPPPTPPGTVEVAPVPAFLAGRSSRPQRPPKADDRVGRDEVVPSWEIDGRYGAEAGGRSEGGGTFGRVLTAVAVLIILALGIAAVALVPGLLTGNPGQTTRPSQVGQPSVPASAGASGIAVLPTPTAAATPVAPTVEPTPALTPAASPRLYKIKAGDTLARISNKFHVPVEDILAANPQIPNADHIEIGQFIVIPFPAATPAP